MDPLSILLGVGGAVQGLYNTDQTRKTNQANEHFTREMYEQQKRDAEAQWHKNNEYNSPRAQMQRFQAAGLNPNLIYGQMGNSAPIANSSPQQHRKEAATADIISPAAQSMMAYQNVKMSNAQADNLEAQNTVLVNQAANVAADTALKLTNNEASQFELGKLKELRQNSLDTAVESLRKLQLDIANTQQSAQQGRELHPHIMANLVQEVANKQHTAAQIQAVTKTLQNTSALQQYEIQLNKMGINRNDPMWARGLAHIASVMLNGASLKEAIRQGLQMITSNKN